MDIDTPLSQGIEDVEAPHWGPRIQRTAITDEVIARFKELIHRGVLTYGTKLPSERALAEVLGVSRPTVRQALKGLQILGIVRSRQGDGSYLEAPTGDFVRTPLEFSIALTGAVKRDLFETRQTLEIRLSALAAERRTDEDIANLQRALARMRSAFGLPEPWCEHELSFHAYIVGAARNTVMASIIEMLAHLLRESRLDGVRQLTDYEGSYRTHELVYEEIARGDARAAANAMVDHFRFMEPRLTLEDESPEGSKPSRPEQ